MPKIYLRIILNNDKSNLLLRIIRKKDKMKLQTLRAALIGTSLIALTSHAFGQSASDADEIVVTGRYLSIDELNAVKTPTPIINIPQSLSIITEDAIKNQAFTNIGDITRYTPGMTTSQGEGHRDAIIIRGQQTTADFFQDGVRDDVEYFRPLYNVQQVEILRGSNALLFGRGGTGGIVNRVTKKAEFGEQFTGLSASVDTFGAYTAAIDSNYSTSDRAGFRLNAFYEGLNNHRNFFDGERFGINPTGRFELSPQTSLNLSYEYLDDIRSVDRGVPSVDVADGPDTPLEGFDNAFFGSPGQNLTKLQAHILRARVEYRFSDNLKGNVTAQYADYDKLYQNLYSAGYVAATNQITLDGYRDTTRRENLFLQANLVGEFETGQFTHTILFGAEYGNQNTSNARLDNVFAASNDDQVTIDLTDPLVIPAFSFTNPARDRNADVQTLSIYAQDQIDLTDQFKIVLGARFDSFDIDVNDVAGNDRFKRKDEEVSPRLGLIYKPAENVSIYGSYSETFLPRSGDQFLTLNLTNSQTDPQSFENLEAGLKWDIRPDLNFTAAIFDLDRAGFLTQQTGNQELSIAVEGSKTQGLEFQFLGSLTERWNINVGYTYLDGDVRFAGNPLDGNRTRQTPKHSFSLWNTYELSEQIGLGAGATYQGSYFVREDNSVEVPDYIRFDASAHYDVSDSIRLQVNVENLLDTDYFPAAHSNDNISTGKPLNARFTVSSKF